MCSAIERAQGYKTKLRLLIDQERELFDVSVVPSTIGELKSTSLSQLLKDKFFHKVTVNERFRGTVDGKFGSHKKAVLALSLAQCLMDFIDEELELASHSWNPEQIFFLYPESTTASDGTLYISLRPKRARYQSLVVPKANLIKSIRPGNPVLLSFARLLLEIYDGEEISLNIDQDNSTLNAGAWGQMCSALADTESEGSDHFLSAVNGCLYLHMRLQEEIRGAVGPAAAGVLRRVMYKNIVRNLELMVDPDSTKRKRDGDPDDVADLLPFKKVSVSPPPLDTGSEALLALSSGATDPKEASGTELVLRCKEDNKCSPLSTPLVDRHIKKPGGTRKRRVPQKQAPVSATLVRREAIPTTPPMEDLVRSFDMVTLYDDENVGRVSQDSEMATEYLSRLDCMKRTFILPLVDHPTVKTEDERLRRPVRIAVLDSGVDMSDPLVKGAAKRIKEKRNWTDDDPENWTDTYGHGTHVARLLIRVAPAAEIYIARVSTAKEIRPEKTGLIAKVVAEPLHQLIKKLERNYDQLTFLPYPRQSTGQPQSGMSTLSPCLLASRRTTQKSTSSSKGYSPRTPKMGPSASSLPRRPTGPGTRTSPTRPGAGGLSASMRPTGAGTRARRIRHQGKGITLPCWGCPLSP